MSVDRRVAFGTAAIWGNRAISVLFGLVLVPILFDQLPAEELGLWFLLAQAGAFVGLIDFGVSVTLTRRIAILEGRRETEADVEATYVELADLMATARYAYRWVALAMLLVGFAVGAFFLAGLDLERVATGRLMLAWLVLCIGHAIVAETGRFHSALNGAGHVGWDAVVAACVTALTTTGQIAVALLGGGLLELAAFTAGGALVSRELLASILRRRAPRIARAHGTRRPEMLRAMYGLSLRAWLTTLGAFLVLKTDQYFIALFRGAADIPAYHAAYLLVANCHYLAVSFATASSVFVSRLWSARDVPGLQRLVWRSLRLGMGFMVCGVAFLTVCGESAIELWLGPGRFVGMPVLATFCVMLTLETQHVVMATACRATGDEAFAGSSLVAGALNVLLTSLLIGHLGLWGVALATAIAQLLTNNWYAVARSLKRLEIGFLDFVRRGVLPVLLVLGVAWSACTGAAWLGAAWLGAEWLGAEWIGAEWIGAGQGETLGRVLGGAAAAAIVLALFSWRTLADRKRDASRDAQRDAPATPRPM